MDFEGVTKKERVVIVYMGGDKAMDKERWAESVDAS